jgi:hypothetical protein
LPNQFYVQPAGDFSAGLSGLSSVLQNVGEQRQMKEAQRAQEERLNMGAQALRQALQTEDPSQILGVAIEFPELAANAKMLSEQQTGIRDAERREFMFALEMNKDNPEAINRLYQERIKMIQARGGDPKDTIAAYQQYAENPQAKIQENSLMLPFLYADDWKAWREAQGGGDAARAAATYLGEIQQDLNAGLITPEQADFLRETAQAPPSGVDQRERRISDYMRKFGMSEEDAIRAVDRDVRLDERGNVIAIDPITGEASVLEVDFGERETSPRFRADAKVGDLSFDPAQGTGLGAAFVGWWNSTIGQAPFIPMIGRNVETTAQQLRLVERDAIRALASSGRPPVVEQERILSAMPKAMDAFENPVVAQDKMAGFVNLMVDQYVDDLRYSDDPRNDRGSRNESRERANAIEGIMRRVMTPEASDAMLREIRSIERDVGEIRRMSDADLLNVDISTLDDIQLQALMERLRGR